MAFLDKMWNEHRTLTIIVGLVLLPLTLLLIGLKIYMAMQVNAAHKEVEKAIDTDKKLEAEENALKKDRKSTRLNSSHIPLSRMPSSA